MKKLTEKALLIILLTIFSEILIAQRSFEPGYLILKNGDKAYGELFRDKELKLTRSVLYRESGQGSAEKRYFKKDIDGFVFTNSHTIHELVGYDYLLDSISITLNLPL